MFRKKYFLRVKFRANQLKGSHFFSLLCIVEYEKHFIYLRNILFIVVNLLTNQTFASSEGTTEQKSMIITLILAEFHHKNVTRKWKNQQIPWVNLRNQGNFPDIMASF